MHDHSDCRFLLSQSVWDESVETPTRIHRFELNAERIREAVEMEWMEIVQPTSETKQWAAKIADWANHSFLIGKKPLAILQAGEIETMALYLSLQADAMAIDERTCRMLVEEPLRLQNHIAAKYDKKVSVNQAALAPIRQQFKSALIVRSCDLLAWTYKHDLFGYELSQNPATLEASLFAVKTAGCAVASREILDYINRLPKK
ncbi:MAG: hypothetical protein V1777_03450 [Candidatus Micrarchaeota archaeon]